MISNTKFKIIASNYDFNLHFLRKETREKNTNS